MTAKKRSVLFGCIFISVCLICAAIILKKPSSSAKTAVIRSGNKIIKTIDLSGGETLTFDIPSPSGGKNTVHAENGKIGVIFADCPDRLCVKQGMTGSAAFPIVCLPHKLSIEITDADKNRPDAAAR